MRKGRLKGCGVATSSSYRDARLCPCTAGPKLSLPQSRSGLQPWWRDRRPRLIQPAYTRAQVPDLSSLMPQQGAGGLLDSRRLQAEAARGRKGRVVGQAEAQRREGRGWAAPAWAVAAHPETPGFLSADQARPAQSVPAAVSLKEVP